MEEKSIIRNLADIEEIEKVPLDERVKERSTYEVIENGAQINPDGVAISFLHDGDSYEAPVRITYGELIGKIRQTANLLNDLGIGPRDVVTYVLPNLPQTHYILWGAETAGIANPVNPLLEADTIKDICNAAKTKILVTLGDVPGSDIWSKINSIRKDIPSLNYTIRVMGPADETEKIYGFEDRIEQYADNHLTFDRRIDRDDIASIYHTGGTTGRPKLARRTHHNEIVVSWDLRIASGLQPGEAVMCGLPLFHCNGTCVTGLMPFGVGGEVVLLSPAGYREPSIMKNFYKIVETYRPVFFSCVPTILSVLLDIPVENADISSLRYVICGAAPLSVELFNRFEQHSGMKILEGYGLTESAVACAVNPKDGERKVGSIGIRLPYQDMKIVVLDEDGRYLRDAETDEIGVVCIKGPCIFKGYVEDIHNREIWVQEEWFNSGDLGRQDRDGFFWLTGRKKELIIRGGHNIDPATIEEPLYRMPSIKVAAAVGRPDAHAGEVPVAYVELADDADATPDDIVSWAREHIGERAAIPKEVVIVDEIPLTAVGKLFKPALRWDATRRIYEKELEGLGDLVDRVRVEVGEDRVHGTCAKIYIKPADAGNVTEIKKQIPEILSRYTIYYEIEIE
jgi:fatty-acyl-CoA synthase